MAIEIHKYPANSSESVLSTTASVSKLPNNLGHLLSRFPSKTTIAMSPVQIRNPAIVKGKYLPFHGPLRAPTFLSVLTNSPSLPRRWLRYHVNFYMNAPSPQEQPIPGLPLFDGLGQKTQFLSTSSS
ncbi:hypothetical protein N7468_003872 [Penicillium chermesinum]|uniref:Uncharacterized protein n=1 Tax=Penicillium chermesinum TaxID=63820 RepID=A0A9W9P7D2_9EURO|nr:uncharacterized protein N7468_003872 [Penicillium chermesinum]KAJ5239253.1 hypothetical protein N7468_003872 [Penicillium chermesinum]